ncbi:hypothetical protein GCM10011289_24880 [Paludibacterium paludis]|uniref:Uncharacterized protein n=2 Tax=Paludibacterium paludis TaxID=1225769 RepID=A0A918UAS3_9NEIS|nr:hypothetical protein GCM10011289_24880 [Paludibacterium paludis]
MSLSSITRSTITLAASDVQNQTDTLANLIASQLRSASNLSVTITRQQNGDITVTQKTPGQLGAKLKAALNSARGVPGTVYHGAKTAGSAAFNGMKKAGAGIAHAGKGIAHGMETGAKVAGLGVATAGLGIAYGAVAGVSGVVTIGGKAVGAAKRTYRQLSELDMQKVKKHFASYPGKIRKGKAAVMRTVRRADEKFTKALSQGLHNLADRITMERKPAFPAATANMDRRYSSPL